MQRLPPPLLHLPTVFLVALLSCNVPLPLATPTPAPSFSSVVVGFEALLSRRFWDRWYDYVTKSHCRLCGLCFCRDCIHMDGSANPPMPCFAIAVIHTHTLLLRTHIHTLTILTLLCPQSCPSSQERVPSRRRQSSAIDAGMRFANKPPRRKKAQLKARYGKTRRWQLSKPPTPLGVAPSPLERPWFSHRLA